MPLITASIVSSSSSPFTMSSPHARSTGNASTAFNPHTAINPSITWHDSFALSKPQMLLISPEAASSAAR
jgi:hypothetical protein